MIAKLRHYFLETNCAPGTWTNIRFWKSKWTTQCYFAKTGKTTRKVYGPKMPRLVVDNALASTLISLEWAAWQISYTSTTGFCWLCGSKVVICFYLSRIFYWVWSKFIVPVVVPRVAKCRTQNVLKLSATNLFETEILFYRVSFTNFL